jgi:1-acyl-sn-glycerol-3-phosphate acyltransferase
MYRIRVYGLENYPVRDGDLICPNHQSNLDPLVVGVACPRAVNYLGKETLFRWPPLGWFLRWNDVIPIDRSRSGIGGMKETLRRLKRGESVALFPEGSRSRDGELQPLMKGFCSLARRTSARLVPVGIEGTFAALPPSASVPRPGRVRVVFGTPIDPDEYADLDDDQLVELLSRRIAVCFAVARERYQQT